jgi:hypothetical protein
MADEQATREPNLSLRLEDSELHECRPDMNAGVEVLDDCGAFVYHVHCIVLSNYAMRQKAMKSDM